MMALSGICSLDGGRASSCFGSLSAGTSLAMTVFSRRAGGEFFLAI
jgi:hypothetical protein